MWFLKKKGKKEVVLLSNLKTEALLMEVKKQKQTKKKIPVSQLTSLLNSKPFFIHTRTISHNQPTLGYWSQPVVNSFGVFTQAVNMLFGWE